MIAIGALGGSGTRVVAEVLIQSGLYLGDDLNETNDNLIFTRLFKNPEWYKNSSIVHRQKRMRIFEKYMRLNKLSFRDFSEMYFASKTNPDHHSSPEFYFHLLKKVFGKGKITSSWGWKEPNTLIYIGELFNFFDQLKYIHVLRHGLDMAFSKNKQQLYNWGWKYGINLDGKESADQLAVKQLDYWIETTKDVIQITKKNKDRCLILNYFDFCKYPKKEIDKLLNFAGVKIPVTKNRKLYCMPKNSGSNNRYQGKDLNIFDSEKIKFVQDMGFRI
jgi:hypothetical protein